MDNANLPAALAQGLPWAIIKGCIAGLVAYLVWKGIRRLLFLLKLWLKYDLPKLPQKAGVAAAAAVDSAKSVKDAFVEGYKNKR
mgnify:CR=1 FL=1